jgi:hypothetical protein
MICFVKTARCLFAWADIDCVSLVRGSVKSNELNGHGPLQIDSERVTEMDLILSIGLYR